MTYDYDLLVIGAGSAGLAAAKRAAAHGVKVAIVEKEQVGGTCSNRGCIPKKLMVYAADFAQQLEDAKAYGWQIEPATFNWPRFVKARDQELERLRQVLAQSLTDAGVELLRGTAAFVDAHTLTIADRTYTAKTILIAVGGHPDKPDIPGIEHALTSREIFQLPTLPKHIAILGGGYIGVEFASILHGLGVKVTLINQADRLISQFDSDLQQAVEAGLQRRGIEILANTTAKEIEPAGKQLNLALQGDHAGSITADLVLCATGRSPNLESLQLDRAGVKTKKQVIVVDDYSQTSQPHIYAVGDCTNRLPLTPVAKAEGQAFADTVFGQQPRSVDYNAVPSAVFARPEVAAVGLTEEQAREQYGDEIECQQMQFKSLYHWLSASQSEMLFKLVIHSPNQQVLGVHIAGDHAAEIIQGVALAMQNGITRSDLEQAIGIHPTSTEELFEG